MIIASLAVVVMHSSLAALVSEQGLPLGITTSPFSFARVSYFWSPALWGGFLGMLNRQRRGIFTMVCLLLASGLLSITAGPASAVLMLPRINVISDMLFHFLGVTDLVNRRGTSSRL